MPQARSAGSSTSKPAVKPASSKSATTKTGTTRSAAAKRTTSRASAAKPATGGAAASRAGATKSTTAKASTAKASTAKSSAARGSTAKTSSGAGGSAKTADSKRRVRVHVNADSAQIDAIAERVRKLNEKIIEVGREAGESTLASYEKALKSIANGVSKGSAKDEFEWITHLASSQAKFVRDITDGWAKAARDRLK